ncbi:unnamed protein product, partial [Urochloa humidicola]
VLVVFPAWRRGRGQHGGHGGAQGRGLHVQAVLVSGALRSITCTIADGKTRLKIEFP